jgi:hypothetical protein
MAMTATASRIPGRSPFVQPSTPEREDLDGHGTHARSRAHRVEVRSSAEAALPPPVGRDDIRLVAALKAGDEAAFLSLIEQHESAMLRVALGFVGTRARAEDVVQETWLAVIHGLGRLLRISETNQRVLLHRARSRVRRELDPYVTDGSMQDDPQA